MNIKTLLYPSPRPGNSKEFETLFIITNHKLFVDNNYTQKIQIAIVNHVSSTTNMLKLLCIYIIHAHMQDLTILSCECMYSCIPKNNSYITEYR